MDEICSGAQPSRGPAGAGADRRNVGICVGACVGACVGPDRQGTSVGPAYRILYLEMKNVGLWTKFDEKRRFMDQICIYG